MKTPILTFILFSTIFIGCSPSTKNDTQQSVKSGLTFILKNSNDIALKEIEVNLPDTTLYYENLGPNSQTPPILVKSSYSYSPIKFKDASDTLYKMYVKDYTGETLYTTGNMTFILDSLNQKTKSGKFSFSIK